MIQWTPYIFVRLLFFLIAGILFQIHTGFYYDTLTFVWGWLVLLYLFLRFFIPINQRYFFSPLMGFLAFSIIFLAATVRTFQSKDIYKPEHIIHQGQFQAYLANVIAEVQEKKKSYKTEVEVEQILVQNQWQKAIGKMILYIRKDSLNKTKPRLLYGDRIIIQGHPQKLRFSGNPHAFDYSRYLAFQYIYHQHSIKKSQYRILDNQPQNYLKYWAMLTRNYCENTFKKLIQSEQEYGIANALILGIKDGLDSEIIQAYSGTGIMHVLAVSGMHVGLIYVVLVWLLGGIKKIKYGSWIFSLLVLSLLWFYAFVTGLSASVLRAIVMFSFVIIAETLQKRNSIYNTLAASAFFLLLYNPFLIISAGFLLSYLAVLGIVYLYPLLYHQLDFENRILDGIWSLICISIAAQLATSPMGLYFFHQFPNYFLLSNLLIIPVSTGALYLGLLTLAFSFIPYLNLLLGFLLKWNIWLMNFLTFRIEELPFALSQNISIGFFETILIYILIISIIMLFALRKFSYLLIAFVSLLLISAFSFVKIQQNHQQKAFIMYHIPRQSNIQIIEGNKAILLGDSGLAAKETSDFHIKENLIYRGIRRNNFVDWNKISQTQLKRLGLVYQNFGKFAVLFWQGKSFLLIKEYLSYQELAKLQSLQINYFVLQNNAVYSLEKIFSDRKPHFVILDSSNSWGRNNKLSKEAIKLKIPCHNIFEKGAFVLEIH